MTFEYSIDKNSEIAKNLKGHLMLITGDIDNNVHPSNTYRLADALIKANKRFDMMVLPGQRHGYTTAGEYVTWLRADYFAKHLLGDFDQSVDMWEINREQQQADKSQQGAGAGRGGQTTTSSRTGAEAGAEASDLRHPAGALQSSTARPRRLWSGTHEQLFPVCCAADLGGCGKRRGARKLLPVPAAPGDVAVFPASSDPLEKIPPVRMALWPVSARARIVVRLAGFALNPILWLTMALLVWQGRAVAGPAVALVIAATVRARVPRSAPRFAIGRAIPFVGLATSHLRQMLTVLDTWLALVLAAIARCGGSRSRTPILQRRRFSRFWWGSR